MRIVYHNRGIHMLVGDIGQGPLLRVSSTRHSRGEMPTYHVNNLIVTGRENIPARHVERLPVSATCLKTSKAGVTYDAQKVPRVALSPKQADTWLLGVNRVETPYPDGGIIGC